MVRRDLGTRDARIARNTCAIIADSLCTLCGGNFIFRCDCAMRSARKIKKNFHENRTSLRRFLQSFGVRYARCVCATHDEVLFEVLKMI